MKVSLADYREATSDYMGWFGGVLLPRSGRKD